MADQPWHELPPEIAGVLRPALDDVASEMMEAVRTVPALLAPADGPVRRRRSAPASSEALRHFLAEIEARRPGRAPRRLPGARPRRDACRPQPRLAAQRVPRRRARRVAPVRGGRRATRGSSPTRLYPARRVDLRLHRRALGRVGRGLRARAVRGRERGRAVAAGGSCGCSSASPRPDAELRSRRPPATRAGSCRASSRCSRSPVSSRTRRRPRLPATRSPRRSASSCAR